MSVVSLSCLDGSIGCQQGAKPSTQDTAPTLCDALQRHLPTPITSEHPVRIYGELSAAAIVRGEDLPLAMWYALRALNTSGSGVLDYARALTSLTEYAYTEGTARRHLRQGLGTYWTFEAADDGRTQIRLFSLLRISAALGVSRLSWPVEVAARAFRGLKRRRAAMYAAWLAHRKDKPISRQAITTATGIGRRRQQRYDTVSHTGKRPNWAFSEDHSGLHPWPERLEGKSQLYWQIRQLPNSFATTVRRAPLGMIRRVNAKLRRSFQTAEATTRAKRCYFESGAAAARCNNRHPEAFVRLRKAPISFLQGTAWVAV